MNKNHVILLVEDNQDDEELTRLAFKECKFATELVVVRDGQEALDYLFATGKYSGRDVCDQPQVVLLDLKLPKVDGLEVLHRIRADERTKCLPVVILTSSKQEQDMVAGYSLGANSYIQKPVDFNQFIDAVRQLGLYWLVLNETAVTCCK
ncbi:MAG: response regulator [Gallionella sp.]|nr:response regulator [Gallionella sp.]